MFRLLIISSKKWDFLSLYDLSCLDRNKPNFVLFYATCYASFCRLVCVYQISHERETHQKEITRNNDQLFPANQIKLSLAEKIMLYVHCYIHWETGYNIITRTSFSRSRIRRYRKSWRYKENSDILEQRPISLGSNNARLLVIFVSLHISWISSRFEYYTACIRFDEASNESYSICIPEESPLATSRFRSRFPEPLSHLLSSSCNIPSYLACSLYHSRSLLVLTSLIKIKSFINIQHPGVLFARGRLRYKLL